VATEAFIGLINMCFIHVDEQMSGQN